jgi:hypothetical protein
MSLVKCFSETWQGDARVAENEITSRRSVPDLEKSPRPGLVDREVRIRTAAPIYEGLQRQVTFCAGTALRKACAQ